MKPKQYHRLQVGSYSMVNLPKNNVASLLRYYEKKYNMVIVVIKKGKRSLIHRVK